MVTARVDRDTTSASRTVMPRGTVLAVRPAMFVATGASSRPMIATMAPMAAEGNMTSIQRVPAKRTTCETRMKTRPKTMKPPWAAE